MQTTRRAAHRRRGGEINSGAESLPPPVRSRGQSPAANSRGCASDSGVVPGQSQTRHLAPLTAAARRRAEVISANGGASSPSLLPLYNDLRIFETWTYHFSTADQGVNVGGRHIHVDGPQNGPVTDPHPPQRSAAVPSSRAVSPVPSLTGNGDRADRALDSHAMQRWMADRDDSLRYSISKGGLPHN